MRRNLAGVCILTMAMLFPMAPPLPAFDPYVTPDIHLGELTGTWAMQIGSMRHVITFKDGANGKNGVEEGTFTGIFYVGNQIADEYEGTWKQNPGYIEPPWLTYVYTKSRRIAAGSKDQDAIVTLNAKQMVVFTSDGLNGKVYRTWQRVKDK